MIAVMPSDKMSNGISFNFFMCRAHVSDLLSQSRQDVMRVGMFNALLGHQVCDLTMRNEKSRIRHVTAFFIYSDSISRNTDVSRCHGCGNFFGGGRVCCGTDIAGDDSSSVFLELDDDDFFRC